MAKIHFGFILMGAFVFMNSVDKSVSVPHPSDTMHMSDDYYWDETTTTMAPTTTTMKPTTTTMAPAPEWYDDGGSSSASASASSSGGGSSAASAASSNGKGSASAVAAAASSNKMKGGHKRGNPMQKGSNMNGKKGSPAMGPAGPKTNAGSPPSKAGSTANADMMSQKRKK